MGDDMEAKLIRERVAQYIGNRAYLHEYECPKCGDAIVRSKFMAKRSVSCYRCRKRTHGLRRHTLYSTWAKMKERCTNPNSSRYKTYGARGISVCHEWNDFQAFFDWSVSNGWSDGLEIDRIDVNGNYCPENCRFVTTRENIQNRTVSKLDPEKVRAILRLASEGRATSKIANDFGVSRSMIHRVLTGSAWQNVTGLGSASRSPQGA